MPADGPPDGYVTSAEACTRLGISDRTLRRRVQAGAIDGEYVARPQGSVLYVKLPAENTAVQTADAADAARASEDEQTATEAAAGGTTPTEPPVAITALVDALAQERAERQRIAAENAGLRERVGRAEAETAAAERLADDLAAELARLRERRWWKFWA